MRILPHTSGTQPKSVTGFSKSVEILPISGCVRMDCDNLLHDDKSVASCNKADLNRLVAT